MSREKLHSLRPFLSLIIFISTLFVLALAKIELRRLGYFALKLSKQERMLHDELRANQIYLAQSTRPERIRKLAGQIDPQRLVATGRIIQISGDRLSFRQ